MSPLTTDEADLMLSLSDLELEACLKPLPLSRQTDILKQLRGHRTETERLTDSLYEFVRAAWPIVESAPFVDNWHIGGLSEHLQAVTEGQIQKLLINIPPGCSKSLLTCVFWPVWEWAKDATVRWFFSSYDQRLSTRDSVKCRALIESAWFQSRWGSRFTFRGDQNLKTYYETDKGGYRLATSIGGHGTGEHPDRIVVDDPQDAQGAESAADRESLKQWWDLTMTTRGVSRKAKRVCIMQRLGSDDFTAHILKEGDWEHICLPMRYEPERMKPTCLGWNDPRSNPSVPNLLTPLQFDEAAVAGMERTLGPYGTAGQLQQRPQPREGAAIKSEWLRYYQRRGARYILQDVIYDESQFQRIFVTCDPAYTSKQVVNNDPDFTAVGAWALGKGGELIWLAEKLYRVAGPDIPRLVAEMYFRFHSQKAICESGGPQKVIVDLLKRQALADGSYMNVTEFIPSGKGDKLARAQDFICMCEAGRVWLPGFDTPDFDKIETVNQLLTFTGDPKRDRHDDVIDNCAVAAQEVSQGRMNLHDYLDKLIADIQTPDAPESDLPVLDRGGVAYYSTYEEYQVYVNAAGTKKYVWAGEERDEALYAASVLGLCPEPDFEPERKARVRGEMKL